MGKSINDNSYISLLRRLHSGQYANREDKAKMVVVGNGHAKEPEWHKVEFISMRLLLSIGKQIRSDNDASEVDILEHFGTF